MRMLINSYVIIIPISATSANLEEVSKLCGIVHKCLRGRRCILPSSHSPIGRIPVTIGNRKGAETMTLHRTFNNDSFKPPLDGANN